MDDLEGLSQPELFHDSCLLHTLGIKSNPIYSTASPQPKSLSADVLIPSFNTLLPLRSPRPVANPTLRNGAGEQDSFRTEEHFFLE